MTLPDWMTTQESCNLPEYSKRRNNWARKAANALSRVLTEMLLDEKTAAQKGLLQNIDARFKVVGIIGLIVISTLIHNISALALLYLLSAAVATASKIPLKRLLKVWLVVPLFSALIVLPTILNIVTPGTAAITINQKLAVTWSGLYLAARFVLRVGVCVTLALLLTATTRKDRLFYGLRALGVPQIFIILLAMMARYLEVLIRSAHEIHLAKISRSIRPGTIRRDQNWTGAGIGMLFRKTYKLGDEIHLAMLSRGYKGEFALLKQPRAYLRDWVFIMSISAIGFGLFLI